MTRLRPHQGRATLPRASEVTLMSLPRRSPRRSPTRWDRAVRGPGTHATDTRVRGGLG